MGLNNNFLVRLISQLRSGVAYIRPGRETISRVISPVVSGH